MADDSPDARNDYPDEPRPRKATPNTAFAPLRVGEFRTLWTASLFSNLGSFIQITAGSWLMWELTASPAWVGWMTAARNLPLLLLAIPAGVLADRLDRTRVLATSQLAMGLVAGVMAVLTWMGWMGPGLLLLLGIALGVGVAFTAPTWQSLVPDLVPRAMVTSAVALNSVSASSARAIGPAIGGILVATVGASAAFGLNAVSYLFMVAAFILVGRGVATRNYDGSSMSRAVVTGLRFAAHTPPFRRL
ncbi:MAG: MFS transporter, partial [Acidimicrobiia bacterium]|nr:MFS transporter [Acidimicrobiia bacterium]